LEAGVHDKPQVASSFVKNPIQLLGAAILNRDDSTNCKPYPLFLSVIFGHFWSLSNCFNDLTRVVGSIEDFKLCGLAARGRHRPKPEEEVDSSIFTLLLKFSV
jgi:hypothetical protein